MANDAAALRGNWNYPTSMRFGVGRIKELPDSCKQLGFKKPLLVTDPGLAKLPMIQEALASLKAAGLQAGLFADIKGNPVSKNVEDGLKVFRDGGYDGIIAFGGGSALDAAKAIALMAGQKRPMWDFEDIGDNWTRADPKGIVATIAVPTTSGTGSEVGRASVITNEATHTKKIIFHPKMLPSIVISDPALTVGLPPHVTAATGMDALAHCLEAYCAPGFHPMADGIAVEGMRLVKVSLTTAVKDGKNLVARANMMAAASMGATAFQKGLGAMHSVAHAVGGMFDTHHGTTIAVMMPYVLHFNRAQVGERLTRLSHCLGIRNPSFEAFLDWVLMLRREVGIPNSLTEVGAPSDEITRVAQMAVEDPSAATNPIAFTADDYAAILRGALAGDLSQAA
jgi:alcohol dehydrogenase class IV